MLVFLTSNLVCFVVYSNTQRGENADIRQTKLRSEIKNPT